MAKSCVWRNKASTLRSSKVRELKVIDLKCVFSPSRMELKYFCIIRKLPTFTGFALEHYLLTMVLICKTKRTHTHFSFCNMAKFLKLEIMCERRLKSQKRTCFHPRWLNFPRNEDKKQNEKSISFGKWAFNLWVGLFWKGIRFWAHKSHIQNTMPWSHLPLNMLLWRLSRGII